VLQLDAFLSGVSLHAPVLTSNLSVLDIATSPRFEEAQVVLQSPGRPRNTVHPRATTDP